MINLTQQTLPLHSLSLQPELHDGITVHNGVGLDAAEQGDASADWQCSLGRLDDQFRFAVTLGGATLPMQLEMKCFPKSKLLG